MSIRFHAVWAVFKRNFASYFGNPSGYVFITIFIVVCAFLAFSREEFFTNNIADLSALNQYFPWLLVVFLPAITMAAWAEERRLGTSELLLTLPVTDLEVVLGKYFAALGVYTASLFFAFDLAFVLEWLGNPDWGLLIANFFGYWLLGAALIPIGLVASFLTANLTVAFILGTTFCAIAVFFEDIAFLGIWTDRLVEFVRTGFGVQTNFQDFTLGVIALPHVLYFILLALLFLYVNMVLLGKRHWRGGEHGRDLWWHYIVRVVAMVVIVGSFTALSDRAVGHIRIDATAEGLNSLAPQTRKLLRELPADYPVTIRAYVSPEVPEEYVPAKKTLLRTLRLFDSEGGSSVDIMINELEPDTKEALEANDRFGIQPQEVTTAAEGRAEVKQVFLAVVMTCRAQEQVIPFIDRGLPVEYELARSLRVVSRSDDKEERKTVGVLKTDIELFGGFNMQTFQSRPPSRLVNELQKQYQVQQVNPDEPISDDIDVLVVPLPSSLTQEQMDQLEAYIVSGRPTLLMIDPAPIAYGLQNAPAVPRQQQQNNPMMRQPPQPPKGNIEGMLRRLGVDWDSKEILWDLHNPLVRMPELPKEFVFISDEAGGEKAFNTDAIITQGLSRVVTMYPGRIRAALDTKAEFTPLMQSSVDSGLLEWDQIARPDFRGGLMPVPLEDRAYQPDSSRHIIAARVRGPIVKADDAAAGEKKAEDKDRKKPDKYHLIVVADLDLMHDQFFDIRSRGFEDLKFNNVTFVLNAIDDLAGDEALIHVRNHEPIYRTLTAIEDQRQALQKELVETEQKARKDAKKAIEEARERLNKRVEAIEKAENLSEEAKAQQVANEQAYAQVQIVEKTNELEMQRDRKIRLAQAEMKESIRAIENNVRRLAIILAPLPAILIGLAVLVFHQVRESSEVPMTRSMRRSQ